MAISQPKVIQGKAKKKGNSTEDIKKIATGLGAAKDAKVEAKAKVEATAARKRAEAQKKAEAKKQHREKKQ